MISSHVWTRTNSINWKTWHDLKSKMSYSSLRLKWLVLYQIYIYIPLEFLPFLGPLTQWCASTLSTALLCSFRVDSDLGLLFLTLSDRYLTLRIFLIPLGIHSICFNHTSINFKHSVNYIKGKWYVSLFND